MSLKDSVAEARALRYLNWQTGVVKKCAFWRNSFRLYSYCILRWVAVTAQQQDSKAGAYLRSQAQELAWFEEWLYSNISGVECMY